MIHNGKIIIRGSVTTWAGSAPDAKHWYGEIRNTESAEFGQSSGYGKYDNAYLWIVKEFLKKYEPSTHVLIICSKSFLLSL